MSFFFGILKCVLCCEEHQPDPDYEPLEYRTTSTSTSTHREIIIRSPSPRVLREEGNTRIGIDGGNYQNSAPVNSNLYRPVNNSVVKQPQVSQSPIRLPALPPSVQHNNSVDSWINNKSSVPEIVKQSLGKPFQVPRSSAPTTPVLQRNSKEQSDQRQFLNASLTSSVPPIEKSEAKKPKVPKTSPSSIRHRNLLEEVQTPCSSDSLNGHNKTEYVWVQKGTDPVYAIPQDIKDLIKNDNIPEVLKKPLSPLTYKDYFAALLYAEDFYIEKWQNFRLENVTLEQEEAVIYQKSNKNKNKNLIERDERDDKIFIAFEIDSVRERRPFLLSRDFVFVRPSGKKGEPFQGFINRVVKSTRVLAEFGDDFHSQHCSSRKYDVTFSFNRVCLKRSHQAVAAAMDPLFRNFLFPDQASKSSSPLIPSHQKHDQDRTTAVRKISMLKGPSPHLVEGPLSVTKEKELSRTGLVIREAVLQIYRTYPGCRILINAPTNSTCDVLMRSLKKEIPHSDMFRANAAFRELDGVPYDILPSCLYKGECFTCPPVLELRNYKVISSTFVSSFRLYNKGVSAGHFSHIFLVDASSATEPETMVALANLADEKSHVVVTGSYGNYPGWVRSNIARENGLKMSYFQRLFESKPYRSLDPMFVTQLGN